MYVERVLSFNGGWSILTDQKANEWQEITTVLKSSGDDMSGSKTQSASIHYAMYSLDFQKILKEYEWLEMPSFNIQSILIKNRVFATMLGVEGITGSNFATEFYLNAPQRYQIDAVDVSVLLIPASSVIAYFAELSGKPSRAANLPTEEFCRAEMAKFGPLTSQASVVLAIFSPTAPDEIIVEEVTPLKAISPIIERTIEFAPEFYQASVGLISYFGEILRQKDPQTKARVRIEQDGNRIRLHIESPSGDIEIIEKELEQYALVLNNQAAPESLLTNQAHIIQLKSQLEMARVQIQTAQEIKLLTEGLTAQRITTLEEQVSFLKTQLSEQLRQSGKVIELMEQQTGSHERIQVALLAHAGMLFKDLLQEASGNQRLLEAIQNLHQNLLSGLTTIDVEEQIKQAIATVKQEKPGMLSRIYTQVEGAALKAGAGASLGWAAEVIKHL